MDSAERRIVIDGGTDGRYLESGHLVYARNGVLLAVPFDLGRMAVRGGPVPVVEGVRQSTTSGGVGATAGGGGAHFTVSHDGLLAYVPGVDSRFVTARTLVWVDRQGREEPVGGAPARAYVYPRISPDGTRIAVDTRDQEADVWVFDLARQTLTRVTADPAPDVSAQWTPDGTRIAFSSARAGPQNIFWQAWDGTGTAEPLLKSPNFQYPQDFSRDGSRLIFLDQNPTGGNDLGVLRFDGDWQVELIAETDFEERNPDISPDDRWVAYQSDESGSLEIWVRPFPDISAGRQLVSTDGGTRPLWAPSGRELFYLTTGPTPAMMVVPVQPGPTLTFGTPVKLFEGPYFVALQQRTYDVSRDGQRFLMVKESAAQAELPPHIVIVENWFEELKARVPTK